MQTENKFFDDLTRMMSGAMSAAGGMREEAEARMRQHFEAMFARMDLVRREEFNVVRDMAALARQENERLAVRTHQLTLGLMRADSAADTLRRMTASLSEDFAGDRVSIVLRQPVAGLEHAEWLSIRGADDAGWEDFADLLASAEPTCGRVQSDRLAFLFQAHAATLQSVAILPLVDRGLLAVGSCDGNRFFPGMGTLFLRMMAEALGVALARFDVATD